MRIFVFAAAGGLGYLISAMAIAAAEPSIKVDLAVVDERGDSKTT